MMTWRSINSFIGIIEKSLSLTRDWMWEIILLSTEIGVSLVMQTIWIFLFDAKIR